MREAHAHEAVLRMEPDPDLAAPGGAVTLALCGSWDHPPPCPLAPHHTSVERDGDDVVVRVLFAAEAGQVASVRERIEAALREQHVTGPDDVVTRWLVSSSTPSAVRLEERGLASRLVGH